MTFIFGLFKDVVYSVYCFYVYVWTAGPSKGKHVSLLILRVWKISEAAAEVLWLYGVYVALY